MSGIFEVFIYLRIFVVSFWGFCVNNLEREKEDVFRGGPFNIYFFIFFLTKAQIINLAQKVPLIILRNSCVFQLTLYLFWSKIFSNAKYYTCKILLCIWSNMSKFSSTNHKNQWLSQWSHRCRRSSGRPPFSLLVSKIQRSDHHPSCLELPSP